MAMTIAWILSGILLILLIAATLYVSKIEKENEEDESSDRM